MTPTEANFSLLIVDDDNFLLDMYLLKFKSSGCTVTTMSDSLKALELLRSGATPDIILLDVIMPGMTGFDFLGAVRKENLAPDATVIILSNQGQDEDIAKANELGADGYIIKASAIPSEVLKKTLEIANKKRAANA